MSSSGADEVIAKLRLLRTGALESETLKLTSLDGDSTAVRRACLRRCSFFEDLLNNNPNIGVYAFDVTNNTLKLFKAFVERLEPTKLTDAFEAILFGRAVQSDEFTRHCCELATGIVAPRDAKVKDIAFVARALVNYLPTRTFEHYNTVLTDLTRHLSSGDKDLIIDGIAEALGQKKDEVVTPIPVPLFSKWVTVALMEDAEEKPVVNILVTLYGNANRWLPFNMFGPNFCPFAEQVKNFHLGLGRYVVYENDNGQVLCKDLRSRENPAQMIFPSCKFFCSRRNGLHVICEDESDRVDRLYEWNHSSMGFEEKYTRPPGRLSTAHRRRDGALVIDLVDGRTVTLCDRAAQLTGQDLSYFIERRRQPLSEGDREDGGTEIEVNIASQLDGLYTTLNKTLKNYTSRFIPPNTIRRPIKDSSPSNSIHGPMKTFSDVQLFLTLATYQQAVRARVSAPESRAAL